MSDSDSDEYSSDTSSNLCVRCLNIPFDLFLGERRTYALYNSRFELRSSAEHCVACSFWYSLVCDSYAQLYKHQVPVILSSLGVLKIQCGLEDDADGLSVPLSCQAEFSGQWGRRWGDLDYLTSSSLSRESIDLMKALIDDCLNSHDHPLCRGFQEFSGAPSRLLFVGDAVTGPQLRVIRTSELFEVPVYVALSHCWGSVAENAPWKLNRTTAIGFQHEVPESVLPQTFVEAVKVTRGLGQSYLWIDSLCILQDCSIDWQLESSKMAGVYANALCTLGSASDSAQGGCVGERLPSEYFRLQLAAGTIDFYRIESYVYENGPICRRAWCLQERVLARRFIQFADLGFMWFCAFQSVLEYNFLGSTSSADLDLPLLQRRKSNCRISSREYPRLPMGSDLTLGSSSQASGQKKSLVQGWGIEAQSKLYAYWYKLVELYSGRKITKPSDLLPAIAGLAEQLAKRLPEDLYVMGLWLFDLNNGLLWTVLPKPQEPGPKIAPSWSWLSDGNVQYHAPCGDETELYGDSRVPTFFFLSAIDKAISPFPLLRVLAPLVRVKGVQDHENPRSYYLVVCDERILLADLRIECVEIGQASLYVSWDRHSHRSHDATFHCLVLAKCHRTDDIIFPGGLVLECVDPKINLYRRIGAFRWGEPLEYWHNKTVFEALCALDTEEFYIK